MGMTKKDKVIREILKGETDEDEILRKNKVGRKEFETWLDSEEWQAQFERHVRKNERRAQILITNFLTVAAAKLVGLTESDKDDTARKSCLDILQMPRIAEENNIAPTTEGIKMSAKSQNEIMAIMAEEAKNARTKEP